MNTLELNNGLRIDQLGFGTADIGDDEITKNAVQSAIDVGYRRIDTASYYDNEHVIGEVISNSDLPREEFTIATKVWNSDQGYDGTLNSIQTSMRKLKTDYIDIFLLHWPVPNKRLKSWKAMEELYESGTLKAIGVSNFTIDHLEELIQHSPVPPVINQVEFHPFLFQSELLKYCNSK
ncbi:MAG: aldo/keto reductase, partial [Candidatus Heimdallarchaeota archaeon]|nr:aldo/keto reductase [Candidatus Heimdallarchaeota archaeon]